MLKVGRTRNCLGAGRVWFGRAEIDQIKVNSENLNKWVAQDIHYPTGKEKKSKLIMCGGNPSDVLCWDLCFLLNLKGFILLDIALYNNVTYV